MPVWKNCSAEEFKSEERRACEVKIGDDSTIALSYRERDGELITYEGKEVGPGHYKLRANDGGTADLHRAPDTDWLEGYWLDPNGEEGMWRIELSDEPSQNSN